MNKWHPPNNLLINQIVFHVSLSLSGQINKFCVVVLQGQNKAHIKLFFEVKLDPKADKKFKHLHLNSKLQFKNVSIKRLQFSFKITKYITAE